MSTAPEPETYRVIRAQDCKTMPWKNGGGETTEIAVWPGYASFETFEWRISMAKVASSGPFSHFENIDRTLCIIGGEGLKLLIQDEPPALLDQTTPPFSFPADVPTRGELTAGPIRDLNVMTRRGVVAHSVERLRENTPNIQALDGLTALICTSGWASILIESQVTLLEAGDTLLTDTPATLPVSQGKGATVFLVRLRQMRTQIP